MAHSKITLFAVRDKKFHGEIFPAFALLKNISPDIVMVRPLRPAGNYSGV